MDFGQSSSVTFQNVWLTQGQMADLFQKSVKTVNEHVQNIFSEGELLRGQLSGNSG